MDGVSDTNTEEQILLCIDVLKDDVRSLRTVIRDVEAEVKQRFDRVESDIKAVRAEAKQRFDGVESDIKEIRAEAKQRFDRVESDIKEIKETLQKMSGSS